jgi:Filamin/ABP280 repeat
VTYVAGPASAAQTSAVVPATGTVGAATTITITVRDANGNVRTGNDDSALLNVTVSGANPQTLTVANSGSGNYTATYTPTTAGADTIAITLSTAPISGSPYTSVVAP